VTSTADLLDEHPDALVCLLALGQYGGVTFRPEARLVSDDDDDGVVVLDTAD
jgi:hypothetical protein